MGVRVVNVTLFGTLIETFGLSGFGSGSRLLDALGLFGRGAQHFARWGEYHYCGAAGTTEREAVTRWAKDHHEVAAVADTEDDAREMARLVTQRATP
jgi:hypothetical protein